MLEMRRLGKDRAWTWILYLLLAAALLGLGYGLWHRSMLQKMRPVLVNTAPRSMGVLWTQFGDGQSMPETSLPANATPEMKEYRQNQAALAEKIKQLQTQGINGAPNPQAFALFQQQNMYLLKRQKQLEAIVAQQQARTPLPMPAPLQLPLDASPQLRAYLMTQDQLARDRVAFVNRHLKDDPATRQAAMEKWQKQNEPLFQQLQKEAQALTQYAASAPAAESAK